MSSDDRCTVERAVEWYRGGMDLGTVLDQVPVELWDAVCARLRI